MASKLTNNQTLIREIVAREFDDLQITPDLSTHFEFFVASQVLQKYNLSDDEIIDGIVGNSGDGGCDCMYVFVNDELLSDDAVEATIFPRSSSIELVIIQAKNETSFKEDALMKWRAVSEHLLPIDSDFSDTTRYNEGVRERFRLFSSIVKKLISYRPKITISYYYGCLGLDIHPNVNSQGNDLSSSVKSIYPSANVSVSFIGADQLMDLFNTENKQSSILSLPEAPISMEKNDFVALVKLGAFYRFITDESGSLINAYFESNVRDYQGQNDVNSCIINTLEKNVTDDFWWLNNGVTILASEIKMITSKSLEISSPSIVNGLQTSREIYNYFSAHQDKIENDNRNLLLRIIKPSDDESRDRIIFATNNQTSIPKYSLRVTDEIHFQIELYFKNRGLYYDRRKNYYKNLKKKSSEIVGVSFLAQCLISLILRKPDFARARPSTLLTDDDTYKALYDQGNVLEAYYRTAKVGKQVQNAIKVQTNMSQSEKSDILFYVIYAVVACSLNKTSISFEDLSSLDLSLVSDNFIHKTVQTVYQTYIEKGGNSRVAKDSMFVEAIDAAFRLNVSENIN